jgi:inosose dehydratase
MNGLFQRVATAPISWGVCEVPGWGYQLPVDRVLSEMTALGFTHTELGSAGWLPEEPAPLRAALDRHGLSLLAAFVPLVIHDRDRAAATLDQAEATAALLADLGAPYFNTAPVTSAEWSPRRPLSNGEWDHSCDMLHRLDELCAAHGLTQVLHEHQGCIVETAEEVERVLAGSPVSFVLDTGHLALGGVDPLGFAQAHAGRVGLVHLKDLNPAVAQRLNAGELSLMGAVQEGLFPSLGQGQLPLAAVVTTLEQAGYRGWYVIEQDCALTGAPPPEGQGPILDVRRSVTFLNDDIPTLAAGDG